MRLRSHLPLTVMLLVVLGANVHAQQDQGTGYVFHPNEEIQVAALPSIVADSSSVPDILAASVATAVMDRDVCCGRNSALVDQLASVTKFSLKELGEKVRGKQYLSSGSSIVVSDQYWPGASVNAEVIVGSLMAQHPLLMLWNGHLYVVYGAVFDDYLYDNGAGEHIIHKLFLVDTRFSDKRRYISFDRQTDDWSKVSSLLILIFTR